MALDDITRTIDKALSAAGLDTRSGVSRGVLDTVRRALGTAQRPAAAPAPPMPGQAQFPAFEYAGPGGRRAYKLFVPAGLTAPAPLVVMLHGCQQNPDDFAAGTRMNDLAAAQGFVVAWPAQSAGANGSNCWRWFERDQQQRDGAEPSIIAGIVGEVCARHAVDRRRVYVAGLSAGAAMAAILAETHADLFAAVGVHSGLPCGAAHDVPSAFAAMRGAHAPAGAPVARPLPTIVFHGNADTTVTPANGHAVVQRVLAGLEAQHGSLARSTEQRLANGRRCTRTCHLDDHGRPVVEHWAVEGGGHAWFGGSGDGSFATPEGPDASREMLRFFSLHAARRRDA